jgi:hypothetical protein
LEHTHTLHTFRLGKLFLRKLCMFIDQHCGAKVTPKLFLTK